MTENKLIQSIIESIQDKKGKSITVIDLSSLHDASTDAFVIAQGNSPTQVSAIADNVREQVQKMTGVKPYNYDGYRNSQWIVIDYGTVMVHIFLPDERRRYNLEELWADAPATEIPDLD